MRRLALLTATALVALTAPAAATIVPQEGMLGIELRQTLTQVRSELGAPDGILFVENDIVGRQRIYIYGRSRVIFDSDQRNARVLSINTTSRRERTASGVGVGSTRGDVKRNVRGARCKVEFGVDHCYRGSFQPGRRVTDFLINRRGRVSRVTIGIVVD
jgi:hypothetical protein